VCLCCFMPAACFHEIEENKLHCVHPCTSLRTYHEAQCHRFPVVRTQEGYAGLFDIRSCIFFCVHQGMDTLLRCPICFEFLNITMMTQCSHNCTYHITFTVQFISCYVLIDIISLSKILNYCLFSFLYSKQFVLCAYGSFSPLNCCVLFVTR